MDVYDGIERLVRDGTIDISRWFLDAGGGDGRVGILTSGIFGVPSIVVECDDELVQIASEAQRELRSTGVLGNTPLLIVQGDFMEDSTYAKVGLRFEDIGTIFNFWDNYKDLAQKISRQSPDGTSFLLEGWLKRDFNDLTFLRKIKIGVLDSCGEYLYVYRK